MEYITVEKQKLALINSLKFIFKEFPMIHKINLFLEEFGDVDKLNQRKVALTIIPFLSFANQETNFHDNYQQFINSRVQIKNNESILNSNQFTQPYVTAIFNRDNHAFSYTNFVYYTCKKNKILNNKKLLRYLYDLDDKKTLNSALFLFNKETFKEESNQFLGKELMIKIEHNNLSKKIKLKNKFQEKKLILKKI